MVTPQEGKVWGRTRNSRKRAYPIYANKARYGENGYLIFR